MGKTRTLNEALEGLQARLKALVDALGPRPAPPPQPPAVIPPQEVIKAEVEVIPKTATPAQMLQDIHRVLTEQETEGDIIEVTLNCTDSLQEWEARDPVANELRKLHTLSLKNKGPGTAYLRLHYPSSGLITLENNDELKLDLRKARRKLTHIYYRAAPGQTALVTGAGQW